MSNRNATASWSGYSHQGQVGLLVALRTIQIPGLDLATHFLQYETHEDVAIYVQPVGGIKTYLSVHQVKAYYSNGNNLKSKYNDVLNGAFEPGNQRFLHVVVDVTDWDTSTITNTNNVIRYTYEPNRDYCDTTEIEEYIRIELRKFHGANEALVTSALHQLTFQLDSKIREEHKKATKALFNIQFSLQEINDWARNINLFATNELFTSRKLFYESFKDIIASETILQERIDEITDNIIKPIYGLSDNNFLLFLQRLNLNEKPQSLNLSQVYYNQAGLKQVFFRMLIDVVDTSPTINENTVKYKATDDPDNYVLTAIIDEDRDKLTVVENIINNLKSQNLLWENHALINRNISGKLIDLNPKINEVLEGEAKAEEHNKFMSFTQGTKLVNREDAIQKLNNGAAI